jgi:hypothetical protein
MSPKEWKRTMMLRALGWRHRREGKEQVRIRASVQPGLDTGMEWTRCIDKVSHPSS